MMGSCENCTFCFFDENRNQYLDQYEVVHVIWYYYSKYVGLDYVITAIEKYFNHERLECLS